MDFFILYFTLLHSQVSFHVTVVDLDDSPPEFVGVLPSEADFSIQESDGDVLDDNAQLPQVEMTFLKGRRLEPLLHIVGFLQVILVQDPDEAQPEAYNFTLIEYVRQRN